VRIGSIDLQQRRALIAEIGNNHEGDAELARRMAHTAVDAGAHVVKFQVIDPERLVQRTQTERIAQLGRFRLSIETFASIAADVRSRGGMFMVSAFDTDSLQAIAPHVDAIKIASGDVDFDSMLTVAAGLGRPIVLSTGMSTEAEIRRAIDVIAAALPAGVPVADRLAILHCVSLYPTPMAQANLAAIPALAGTFGLTTGYSDHTLGIEAALVALGLGARIIEKHFTLDKAQSAFRDHALSATPDEFRQLAQMVNAADEAMGSGSRARVDSDAATRVAARRSIVAARDLAAGTVLERADLDCVRPAGGLPPSAMAGVIGRRVARAIAAHDRIVLDDLTE
jgi:N-acetylneuraminate synthase/N,N'-diacetyllegionaminate synthase